MAEIETRHFDSADEFIKGLRRSDPYWLPEDHWQVPWIFRGQRDADWKLVPSSWREVIQSDPIYRDINTRDLSKSAQQIIDSNKQLGFTMEKHGENARRLAVQAYFEFLSARGFADLVDDLGLPLPGGPLPRFIKVDPFRWMMDDEPFHPTVALAQHHGMSTRLLDWTRNPLVAAFFAAYKANADESGNMVVWAAARHLLVPNDCREFTVQRSQIGYLNAQEGLFTFSLSADHHFLTKGKWPSLEEQLPPEALRRHTLPKSQAPRLLKLLWAERISKAHLMPSLDNVVEALRSRHHLDAVRSVASQSPPLP